MLQVLAMNGGLCFTDISYHRGLRPLTIPHSFKRRVKHLEENHLNKMYYVYIDGRN